MAIISKQDHYGCPAPRPMLGGSDVTGWIVEHVVAKVEGEALARIKGEEYSRQREAKTVNISCNILLQCLSDIMTNDTFVCMFQQFPT